jgi:hypothetical protein
MTSPLAHPTALSTLAYANGFTWWHYRSPHRPTEVFAPGYWGHVAIQLRDGDKITIDWPERNEMGEYRVCVCPKTGSIWLNLLAATV